MREPLSLLYAEKGGKPVKFLIASKVSPHHVERLESIGKEAGVEVQVICSDEKETIQREIADADAFVTWWSTFHPEYITYAKQLRWIQTLTAGVDNFLIPEILDRGILLTSCKGIHGIPMSEHMMGMLLGVTRGLYAIRENQKNKSWDRPRIEELYGKTLVILGLGHIGRDLAKRANAFGMRVVGVKRTPSSEEFVDKVYGSDDMMTAIAEGDVVVSILPYTPDTYHLIGRDHFARMKSNAIFMSFGRGDVVDENALIAALQQKQIRAAILDVFEEEPLAPTSPLWEMENVYISPHTSALSTYYMERAMEIIGHNLRAYLTGQPLRNVVDVAKGY